MIKNILLDTSVVIDHLRLNGKTYSLMQRLSDEKQNLCISILTQAELYAGKKSWENLNTMLALEFVLSGFTVLALDTEVSKLGGKISALYNLDIVDSLIAATAILNELPLYTLNTKDFIKIPGLTVLS